MFKNKKLSLLASSALLLTAGCQNYLERHEGVTTHAGNHLAINEAKMVVDPWKRKAYDTNIEYDAKRSADVAKKYQNAHHEKEKGGGAGEVVGVFPAVAPPSQTK